MRGGYVRRANLSISQVQDSCFSAAMVVNSVADPVDSSIHTADDDQQRFHCFTSAFWTNDLV